MLSPCAGAAGDGNGDDDAAGARLILESALTAVGFRLAGTAGDDIQQALHATHARSDQRAVAIIGGTAAIGSLAQLFPTTTQLFGGGRTTARTRSRP